MRPSLIVLNAFSANMLAEFPTSVKFTEVTAYIARHLLLHTEEDFIVSAVGHADTAAVFSSALGLHIPCNRATVDLRQGEKALLGQYSGPRLEEGTTTLPEGATIKWLLVEVGL